MRWRRSPPRRPWRLPPSPLSSPARPVASGTAAAEAARAAFVEHPADLSRARPPAPATRRSRRSPCPEKPPMPATLAFEDEDRGGRARLAGDGDRAAAVRLHIGEHLRAQPAAEAARPAPPPLRPPKPAPAPGGPAPATPAVPAARRPARRHARRGARRRRPARTAEAPAPPRPPGERRPQTLPAGTRRAPTRPAEAAHAGARKRGARATFGEGAAGGVAEGVEGPDGGRDQEHRQRPRPRPRCRTSRSEKASRAIAGQRPDHDQHRPEPASAGPGGRPARPARSPPRRRAPAGRRCGHRPRRRAAGRRPLQPAPRRTARAARRSRGGRCRPRS